MSEIFWLPGAESQFKLTLAKETESTESYYWKSWEYIVSGQAGSRNSNHIIKVYVSPSLTSDLLSWNYFRKFSFMLPQRWLTAILGLHWLYTNNPREMNIFFLPASIWFWKRILIGLAYTCPPMDQSLCSKGWGTLNSLPEFYIHLCSRKSGANHICWS